MEANNKKELIRSIYLYLFSLVGLVLVTIGLVRFVDLGLKVYIFKGADEVYLYPEYPARPVKGLSAEEAQELTAEEKEKFKQEQIAYQQKSQTSHRQSTAAESLAMIIVGLPLFLYHWRVIQKDKHGK